MRWVIANNYDHGYDIVRTMPDVIAIWIENASGCVRIRGACRNINNDDIGTWAVCKIPHTARFDLMVIPGFSGLLTHLISPGPTPETFVWQDQDTPLFWDDSLENDTWQNSLEYQAFIAHLKGELLC